jgi:hypothetical protein
VRAVKAPLGMTLAARASMASRPISEPFATPVSSWIDN